MDKQIKFLHDELNPIVPGIGDIRIVPELNCSSYDDSSKKPSCSIRVAQCVSILEHHVVYEFLNDKSKKAIPLEIINSWGMSEIDEAVKWILNSYMQFILDLSDKRKYSSNGLSEYFSAIQNLVLLSRSALKEANKAKKSIETVV